MVATGFTSGDPNKVDIAGDTMTGPLVLSGDPVVNLGAATKQYAETHGSGGGGGGTPSGTVVTETSYGQAATAGVATTYSRGDHTHGTPIAVSVPGASGTVAAETSFGIASSAGVAATFSRGDHTHGTPANPLGGKVKADALITSGNITVAAGPTFTQLGSDIVIAAAVGDILEITIQALCANTGSDVQFEAATRNAGDTADVNYWSTGTGTPAVGGGGVGSWYVQGSRFDGPRGSAIYVVQAGDINGGNVRVQLYGFGGGGARVVNANTSYPFRWYIKNLGQ